MCVCFTDPLFEHQCAQAGKGWPRLHLGLSHAAWQLSHLLLVAGSSRPCQ